MSYVRVDKMDDGTIAIDTSEGMTREDAVLLLSLGSNEAQFAPPDTWPAPVPPEEITEDNA